jgi:hypothetical protein
MQPPSDWLNGQPAYDSDDQPYEERTDGFRVERTAFTEPPPIRATILHERKPRTVRLSQLAPYLVAFAGVAIAAVALSMFLGWRGQMQAQVDQLKHEVATVQGQAATGDAQLNQSVTGLSRRIENVRTAIGSLSAQLGPFSSQCTTDMTGPAGVAAYVVPCRR